MRARHCVFLVPIFLPWCQPTEREPAPEPAAETAPSAASTEAGAAEGGDPALQVQD